MYLRRLGQAKRGRKGYSVVTAGSLEPGLSRTLSCRKASDFCRFSRQVSEDPGVELSISDSTGSQEQRVCTETLPGALPAPHPVHAAHGSAWLGGSRPRHT